MSKYIDADKLIAQIKELRSESCISEADDYYEYAKSEILDLITSLQQEQLSDYDRALLEVKAKVDKLYDEASIGLNEYDSGLYNGIAETCMKLRGFINARLSLHHAQPESELEKAARYVYESWMGGTMDDVRRDMDELGKVLNARKEE